MCTFKRRCVTSFQGLALLALMLAGSPCYSQSGLVEDPAPKAPLSSDDLFGRVIANQKRGDAELNIYERVERVEIRKTGSDPKPSEVKMWRVFPAGTGMSKIPLTAEAKPASGESFRAGVEKAQRRLIWAAGSGAAHREANREVGRRQKEKNELIDSTRKAFVF